MTGYTLQCCSRVLAPMKDENSSHFNGAVQVDAFYNLQ